MKPHNRIIIENLFQFRSSLKVSLTIFFLCCNLNTAQSPSSSWITRAPLPTPRQEVPHAVLNGKIYVPGGLSSGGVGSKIVEVFDPSTDSWNSAPSLLFAVHHTGLTNHNDVLYLMGGYRGNGFIPTDEIYTLHPDSSFWKSVGLMPMGIGAHVIESFGEKIYLIGGVTPIGVNGATMSYDPITLEWETLSPMPTPREHLAAAVIDSLIYVVGGRDFSQGGPGNVSTLEAYSPETNTWYSLQSMPTARGGLAAAALNGKLYAFGGEFPGVFSESEEYDPKTNTWTKVEDMATPRHGMGAVTVGDTIFIIGGAEVQGFGVSGANEGFTLTATNIDDDAKNQFGQFHLAQNYPNPFNTVTTINYLLPKTGDIQISVYNLLGKEIARLLNEVQEARDNQITWDASNYSSGIYFFRLQAGDFVQTRKMVLLK